MKSESQSRVSQCSTVIFNGPCVCSVLHELCGVNAKHDRQEEGSNHHKWRASRKAETVGDLETLPTIMYKAKGITSSIA